MVAEPWYLLVSGAVSLIHRSTACSGILDHRLWLFSACSEPSITLAIQDLDHWTPAGCTPSLCCTFYLATTVSESLSVHALWKLWECMEPKLRLLSTSLATTSRDSVCALHCG